MKYFGKIRPGVARCHSNWTEGKYEFDGCHVTVSGDYSAKHNSSFTPMTTSTGRSAFEAPTEARQILDALSIESPA